MKKYILEKHVITFDYPSDYKRLQKFLNNLDNKEDFSISSAWLFWVDDWGAYDPAEHIEFTSKEEALKAFAEKSSNASGSYDSLELEGWTLEEETNGRFEDIIAEHEFKGEHNPYYVIANENSYENNESKCCELQEIWNYTIDEEQASTEWAKLINAYNKANQTNATPEDIDFSDLVYWTQEENYFSFEF